MTAALRQTGALFFDAYRELNARKLFWVVLGLSWLIALSFAAVGINQEGITVLWWEVPLPLFNLSVLPNKAMFYKFLFFSLGFNFWLTWFATILALISTASIIPEFVAGGSVDMLLSKPVGRARLFLTKYITGLLFAGIQVAAFSLAAFLVIGIRGEEWVFSLFLAIPLVVLFFSYIYVISAFVGLLTRSTIASILAALAFWFLAIFPAGATEMILLEQRVTYDQAVLILSTEREAQQAALEQQAAREAAGEPAVVEETEANSGRRNRQRAARPVTPEMLATTEERLEAAERDRKAWNNRHAWAFAVKTILPKTTETMGLLERRLIAVGDMDTFTQNAAQQGFVQDKQVHGIRIAQRAIQRAIEDELRSRSLWWIIGTSLLFQGAVLGLASWIFARRDF